MALLRILQLIGLIGLIAGAGALLLGLFYWFTAIDVVNIHMLFGITITLVLLVFSIVGTFTQGLRVLGLVGILYSLLVVAFGMTQQQILIGDLHWIIQVAHLLVGIGAMGLSRVIGDRYFQGKQQKASVQEVAART